MAAMSKQNEQRIEQDLIDLAYKHHIPLVATNDVYFGEEDMYGAHDAFCALPIKRGGRN